ncbi:nuclear pore complex protein NUP98B-like [Glycine soja]|uniref:nuclear pore complex protein NUP98B-like n=1 Tax=Glycine soja TaxID=3848 RepID=UPI000E21BB65|nr:nuclear pore complex protein NUP98B-like [Glycine soja]|eukprot:XP_025983216.1 nuclear pore complex protein NUP98B-like [Glycine max]
MWKVTNIICDRHSLLLLLEEKNAVASFLPQPFITFSSQFHFFGQSSSGFGQNNSSINPFALKPFGITTPFGSPIGFGGSSTGVAQPSSPFASNTAFGFSSSPAFSSSVPSFWSSSTPDLGSSSSSFSGSSVFGQQPLLEVLNLLLLKQYHLVPPSHHN